MANLTVAQIMMDAQKMANRVKDLDALSSALLVEAEGNNRFVESLRQFQDDMDSLNRITNNKSNVDMVNRIQQQNANSSEILKENRELKVCIEDYERAIELIMQKYREHTSSKVLESKLHFKEVYNEKLWKIIREQREKINEMAAVMQRAASCDEENEGYDLQSACRHLRLENKTLRDLLQISKQCGSLNRPIRFNEHLLEEKSVQTESSVLGDDSADELSISGASIENGNNNSVIQLNISSLSTETSGTPCSVAAVDNDQISAVNVLSLSQHKTAVVRDNNNSSGPTSTLVANTITDDTTILTKAKDLNSSPTDMQDSISTNNVAMSTASST